MQSMGNGVKEKEVVKYRAKKMPFVYHSNQSEIESPVKVISPFKRPN
jgi:hypothetical protein